MSTLTSIGTKLAALIAAPALAASAAASALTSPLPSVAASAATNANSICITHNLSYGMRDAQTGGDVTALQTQLVSGGYLSVAPTGFFGPATLRAVLRFQSDNGISQVGAVGPKTRAAFKCIGGNQPPTQNGPVSVYSVSPTTGPVGTSVTITGFGFNSDNTIHFGSGVIQHVAASGGIAIACTTDPNCRGGIRQTITFTVPSSLNPACYYSEPRCLVASRQVTPGAYSVYVENANGTSNVQNFTVTGSGTQQGNLSISGLDAPSTLALGTTGTWTVHAASPSTNFNLHYSVVWGDEATASNAAMIMAPQTTAQ